MELKPPVLIALGIGVFVIGMISLSQRDHSESRGSLSTEALPVESDSSSLSVLQTRPLGAEPVHGRFVYLFDVSASVNSTASRTKYLETIRRLLPAVQTLSTVLDETLPQEHTVASIGTASLNKEPICRVYASRPTLFSKQDSLVFLRTLKECTQRLIGLPAENYSDIRGAIAYAAFKLKSQTPALRGVLLFSDMVEETEPGSSPAIPDLRDVCVAIFMQITPTVAKQPGLVRESESKWLHLLSAWGAKKAMFETEVSYSDDDVAQFFRGCEQ